MIARIIAGERRKIPNGHSDSLAEIKLTLLYQLNTKNDRKTKHNIENQGLATRTPIKSAGLSAHFALLLFFYLIKLLYNEEKPST